MGGDGSLSAKELAAFLEAMGKQLGLSEQKGLLEQILKEIKQVRGILADLKAQAKATGGASD